ncbi:hypothetical protein [Streptomyces mangrovisoli]|uniref:Uncharacterized protein n=1 Tax=Streptomyces mangrovisoli TaxID=1428628 RepID=A0A1J4NMI4_9ACTN|nr:hypothetical protein [Streptomyces mangrovisoli]OIJ63625.1 hypothetical protein WN71_032910 [Streptomyces mangrovisoli]
MPLEQHINWTVLPAGLSDDGTQVRVSVFIAPRLQPENGAGTLADFPDFVDWPARLEDATFVFAAGEDGTGAAPPRQLDPFTDSLRPQSPSFDGELWTSLFHEDTPLQPFSFAAPGEREMRTYSAGQVSAYTKQVYGRAALRSPETPPPTRQALGLPSTASGDVLHGHPQLGGGAPHSGGAGADAPGPQDGGEVPSELAGLNAFHSVPEPSGTAGGQTIAGHAEGPTPPKPPSLPPADFHTILTALGDHPVLLRHLGLVLDFLLPADRVPSSAGQGLLSVVPHWTSALHQGAYDVSCRTRYVFGADPLEPARRVFVPAAQAAADGDPLASPSRGLVVLDGDFSLEQADTDGAAFKMLSVPEDAVGLSPVRTHGLSLVRDNRADSLTTEFRRAADNEGAFTATVSGMRPTDGAPAAVTPAAGADTPQGPQAPSPQQPQDGSTAPVLVAQDVVRGHRLDIWDETRQAWYSLHERIVEYRKPGAGPLLLTASDEGCFQAHLASPPDHLVPSHTPPPLYVPETLVTWNGYSASASRPGLVLDTDPGAPDENRPPNKPVEPNNDAPPGIPLEITVRARPGSLPRLRFGRQYRVRLRTVDLAGNGLGPTEAAAA